MLLRQHVQAIGTGWHAGYTLDGTFVAADIGEGCAMPCERLDTELNVGPPVEVSCASA